MARDQKPDIEKLIWPKDGNKFQWLDRLESILSVATKAGVAYAGYNTFQHPMGVVYGLLGLRLAEAPGALPSNLVGLGILAHIGISNFSPVLGDTIQPTGEGIKVATQTGGGAGGGMGGQTPYLGTIVTIAPSECVRRGGKILTVFPMTNLCSCELPEST